MAEAQPAEFAQATDLEQAFDVFNALSERLTLAYGQLEARVAMLSDQLDSTRRDRLRERAQKEHLADQLGVLLEALPAAVVLVDMRDRIDRFNPAAEQLFPGLAWGRRWSEVKAEVVAAEPGPGDWQLRDGRRVSVSQRPLNDRGRILVVVDMTDQRRLQERVERQDRLSAMGEMAAQLAHQIRTPLSTSVLYAGQLAKDSLNDTQRRQFSDKLLDSLRHTESLVREMLAFSRGGSFTATPIHLDDALHTALAALQPRLRQMRAALHLRLEGADCRRVVGSVDALAGAFSNLIDNALNHGGQGVAITISARCDNDESLRLCFEDDGPGIEPAVLPRIFDPFFTTRERGTGLGLAVVQAVVLEHGGSLSAGRSSSGGARFDIRLPTLAQRGASQPTAGVYR
ncbi:MAG: PAS domain-containing protein [Chromatiaceae bacterium]|nr:PAS domain-containing protein [Gammaproteobacteria bacterium]MCP5301161.1 PAS domain-containing protein [Chromatiaceae bacterium]MCP5421367.1 PAS domain-containing protein [Chromatiaceae bacterium]